jgi:hypothetical protein
MPRPLLTVKIFFCLNIFGQKRTICCVIYSKTFLYGIKTNINCLF